ncbi:MAG: hypothetical protein LBN10_03405 [Propionibacteriaceae bacterium]|jgi:hypothetical protein|nr:hypothetical protein [Propionibacteriaceae bacterium]
MAKSMDTVVGPIKLNTATMKELLHGGFGLDAVLRADAEKVLAKARAIAPVDTGAYLASLHIEEEQHKSRMVVKIVSDDRKAPLVEFQTGTLTQALQSVGQTKGHKMGKGTK